MTETARPGTPQLIEELATFSRSSTLAVYAGVGRFRLPTSAIILGVTAAVNTAPTGASVIVDVNKNGTTVFSTQGNRPTIVAGANATATEVVPDVTSIAAGEYLTIDIDQVGSSVAGADLTVFVRYGKPGGNNVIPPGTYAKGTGIEAGTIYVDNYIADAGAVTVAAITAAVQAALAAAKAAGKWCEFAPRAYTVNGTLNPTDTLIRAYGATITLAAGSNCYLLTCSAGANVTIWGGIWDGNNNAGQQTTGAGFIGYGFYLVAPGPAALTGKVRLKDLEVRNCIKFAILVSAALGVFPDNVWFDTQSDGLHIHGPCPVFRSINGIGGTTGDDMVSCTTSDYPANVTTTGAFGTIEIDALYPVSAGPAFAALGSAAFPFSKIIIKRIEGTVDTVAVRITDDATSGADLNGTTVHSLTISHIDVDNANSSSPIINLAATEIKDARIEDLVHVNTQPAIIVDTSKVVRRLTISGMRSQGSAVQPLVSVLGTCEDLIFESVTATLGSAGKIFQVNGTCSRAVLTGIFSTGGTSVFAQIAGATAMDVFVQNSEIRNFAYGFIIGATCNIHLANVKFNTWSAYLFYLNNTAAVARILAGVVSQVSPTFPIALTGSATISANGEMLVMDATGGNQINAAVAGDRVYDRITSKPVLYNGSAWVAAY